MAFMYKVKYHLPEVWILLEPRCGYKDNFFSIYML